MSKKILSEIKENSILVDFDAVATLVTQLCEAPSLIDLYEAAMLAEVVVLNDAIVLVHSEGGEASFDQRKICKEKLKLWQQESVIEYRALPTSTSDVNKEIIQDKPKPKRK